MTNKKFDIYDRTLKFAADVARFVHRIPKSIVAVEYIRQLIRSSGSIGANLEEADGAVSKKDFINKVGISRKEARESRHWLRLMELSNVCPPEFGRELSRLIGESKELILILSAIIKNSRSVI
jgi:four helix bundle protein